MKILASCFLLIGISSCKNTIQHTETTFDDPSVLKQNVMDSIDSQLARLSSIMDKQNFLEDIYAQDQQVRFEKSKAELNKKSDSISFQKALQNFYQVDVINRYKIRGYFEKYDYPNPDDFSEKAVNTPWLVIQHSDLSYREQFYPEMRSAHDQGFIDTDQFSMYLGRTYEMQFGERFRMPSPFSPDEEIDSLTGLLGYNN